jgi:hypothetical protein
MRSAPALLSHTSQTPAPRTPHLPDANDGHPFLAHLGDAAELIEKVVVLPKSPLGSGERTIFGWPSNDVFAPIPAVRLTTIGRFKSTLKDFSGRACHSSGPLESGRSAACTSVQSARRREVAQLFLNRSKSTGLGNSDH